MDLRGWVVGRADEKQRHARLGLKTGGPTTQTNVDTLARAVIWVGAGAILLRASAF